MRTYHDVLMIDRAADLGEIKAAYRRLAKAYHPDTNPSPDAPAWFREVTEAYDVLRRMKEEGLRALTPDEMVRATLGV